METKKRVDHPSARLEVGAAILTAAKVTDTTLIKGRLAAFAQAHRSYTQAQRRVDGINAQVRAQQTRINNLNASQDDAVEALARSLVADGQPRVNSFAAFRADSPTVI